MSTLLWGVISAGIGVGFAIWSYYRLPVRVPKGWLYILGALRAAAVWAILFLLGEPILTQFVSQEEKPLVVLLADNSQSVFWQNAFPLRSYAEGINTLRQRLEAGGLRTVQYVFDERLQSWDNLNGQGKKSQLTLSLRQSLEQHPEATGVIVLSDGRENGETAPLPKGTPIWTVGVGPPPIEADPAIDAVDLPPWVAEGRPLSIRVRLRAMKEPATLVVSYPRGQQKAAVPSGAREVSLSIPSLPAGIHQLRFLLEARNDPNPVNNLRSAILDVQPQETRIFLWAGEITPDIAFLRARLERLGRVQVIAARKPTGFTLNPDTLRWNAQDLHVLYNFPLRPEDEPWADRLWRENSFLLVSWGAVELRESFRQNLSLRQRGALGAQMVPGGATIYLHTDEASSNAVPIDLGWGRPIGYRLYRGNRLYTVLMGEGWWHLRESPQAELVWDSVFFALVQEGLRLQRTRWIFAPQRNPLSIGEAAVWQGILPSDATFIVAEKPIALRVRPDGLSEAIWLPDSAGLFPYRVMQGKTVLLTGALLVESQTPELQTLGLDSAYLRFIAGSTGGRYIPWEQLYTLSDTLRKVLPATAFLTSQRLTIPFHEWAVWLALILSLLSIEWLLRRYVGLY
ncbi:MAG: hypothetical protein NZZ60_00240 [Bacteroidia bacterium]|nr:hypothetical protein [Bacteroidia bacterium]MDW8416366.1 hypothetical protein [Bacteroidia bacterium]